MKLVYLIALSLSLIYKGTCLMIPVFASTHLMGTRPHSSNLPVNISEYALFIEGKVISPSEDSRRLLLIYMQGTNTWWSYILTQVFMPTLRAGIGTLLISILVMP
jgi:hypothetical protein